MNYWQGNNVRLRAIVKSDWETLVAWDLNSEVGSHMHFLTPPQSPAAIEAFIEKETLKKFENDCYFWIIENLEGIAVGFIDTRTDQRHGTFEYGISVAPEHGRKGYASEAILLVAKYYFDHLRYQKLTAGVHSDNKASIKLHESLGFCLEGTIRNMIFKNGHYVNLHYYGFTLEEFRAKKDV